MLYVGLIYNDVEIFTNAEVSENRWKNHPSVI